MQINTHPIFLNPLKNHILREVLFQKPEQKFMTNIQKISVVIIEDNKVIKENVEKFINFSDDMEVAHHSFSVESFLHHMDKNPNDIFDVMLLDIGLPGMTGLEGISHIMEKLPSLDIIMLTTFEEEEKVIKALCSGAVAYVSKKSTLTNILDAIRIVNNGGSYMSPSIARGITTFLSRGKPEKKTSILTNRQTQIIKELADGHTYEEIADKLSVSENTVKSHIKKLYKTLQVNNKTEAVAKYLRGEVE